MSFAWSNFARERYLESCGHCWFSGSEKELLELVEKNWESRKPGFGRTDLEAVVVVAVNPAQFHSSTVLVDSTTDLHAEVVRRQENESEYISVTANSETEAVKYASVVLYSAETLLENGGQRSSNADWEIVCVIASSVEDEPMDPITMARNFLEKTGGTFCEYTAQQFAESIWFWSNRADKR
jgi:hypothetical protein